MNDNTNGLAPSSSREEEETQSTQEETQATQAIENGSQDFSQDDKETHLFGSLHPCNPGVARYDLWRMKGRYKIGRREGNDIVFSSTKISNFHAEIVWDGKTDDTSCVTIKDMESTNGVYINGHPMKKGSTRILKQGNEIAFGSRVTPETGDDYRFIFYHLAAGSPRRGLYAYYDLGPELGRGSFATVFRAVSKATGEWFAVKIIQESRRTGKEESSSSNVNLQREIAIMKELHHPNICALKDVFVCDNNDINLVIELVDGGDLLDFIIHDKITSEGQARYITRQLCEALSYIHGKGVAHRDLKPENILLTADDPPIVKVADFGLAKVADSMTMLKTMCGTPAYLAPEVVLQATDQGYDNLVDSWSVGVIVFSMLTGQSPFVNDGQSDVRTQVVERRINWSLLDRDSIPTSNTCKDFIRQLLLANPRERLTLTAALNHPWLIGGSGYDESQGSAGSQFFADMEGDVSMFSADDRDETRDGFEQMNIDSNGVAVNGTLGSSQGPSSTPPSQPIPGLGNFQQEPPTKRLQRRSEVLEAAQDNQDIVVPQPSAEMLTRFSAIDQKRKAEARALATSDHDGDPIAGPSNWAADKGPGKRVHAELSTLPEDQEIDMDADSAINGTTSKKGRPSPPESGEELPSTSKRGGKPKSNGGRGGKARAAPPVDDDGDETPLRRSSRNAQKAARRL